MNSFRRSRITLGLFCVLAASLVFHACSAKDEADAGDDAGSGKAGATSGEPTETAGGGAAGASAGAAGESVAAGGGGQASAGGEGGAAGEAELSDTLGPSSRALTDATPWVRLEPAIGAASDAAYNLFLLVDDGQAGQRVEKYDAAFAHAWTLAPLKAQNGDSVSLTQLAVTAEGALLVTGSTQSALPGEAANSGGGVLLGRYTKDKVQAWLTKVPANAEGYFVSVATGQPVVWGNGEALPGQPVDVLGGSFLAQFDAQGHFVSAKQGGDFNGQTENPALTSDGALYVVNQYVDSNNTIARYEPNATRTWELPEGDEAYTFPPHLAATGEVGYGLIQTGFSGCQVVQLLPSGFGWSLVGDDLDVPAAGDEPAWQGSMISCDAIAAAGADLYVAGTYQTISDDSASLAPFVARLTSSGKQRWFRQLALPGDSVNPIAYLLPEANGTLVVIDVNGSVLKLRGRDGLPLKATSAAP